MRELVTEEDTDVFPDFWMSGTSTCTCMLTCMIHTSRERERETETQRDRDRGTKREKDRQEERRETEQSMVAIDAVSQIFLTFHPPNIPNAVAL